MRFDTYQYIFPPRPETAVPKNFLNRFEKMGYVAQFKKNGTANVLAVSPERKLVCMTRHNEAHKAWSPTAKSSAAFENLPGKGWFVFIAELMHSKVPGLRDINYVHDIVVADGEHLVGQTFIERQDLLHDIFETSKITPNVSHHVVDDYTWVARNHTSGFAALFDGITDIADEGLVLKDPKVALKIGFRASANVAGLVKCRKPHKNYSF
jgi:hypothetical protein